MSRKAGLPNSQPWVPPAWEKPDAAAFQALARGDCSPDQQRRALKFLIENLCGTYDLSFRPDDRATVFAEGRRFVGLQVVKLLNINLEKFKHD